jgi:tetratricopeptide (TPR) repeat protein
MRIVQACNNLGGSYQWRGEMDQALALFGEGLQIAQRIGDTRDEALLLTTTAELYLDQGRYALAIDHLERALLLAQESGTVSRLIEAQWLLGVAHQQAGHLEQARQHLETAKTQSRETSYLRFMPRIYLDLARLEAAQGRCARAQRAIEQAVQAAGSDPPDLFMGHLHGGYGTFYACRRDWDATIEHLGKSLVYLERAAVAALVGRTHLDLGTAYTNRGHADDRGHARTHLQAALATFQQIEACRFVAMAQVRLDQLEPA